MPSATSHIPSYIVRDTTPGGRGTQVVRWYWRSYRVQEDVMTNWWTRKPEDACEFDSRAEATRKLREIRDLVPIAKRQRLLVIATDDV